MEDLVNFSETIPLVPPRVLMDETHSRSNERALKCGKCMQGFCSRKVSDEYPTLTRVCEYCTTVSMVGGACGTAIGTGCVLCQWCAPASQPCGTFICCGQQTSMVVVPLIVAASFFGWAVLCCGGIGGVVLVDKFSKSERASTCCANYHKGYTDEISKDTV